jgi:hypothetical protein
MTLRAYFRGLDLGLSLAAASFVPLFIIRPPVFSRTITAGEFEFAFMYAFHMASQIFLIIKASLAFRTNMPTQVVIDGFSLVC